MFIRRFFRKILQQKPNDFSILFVDNAGVMLATSYGFAVKFRGEKLLGLSMSISAIFLSMIFTSILYSDYYNYSPPQPAIDSVEDLASSSLIVIATYDDQYFVQNGSKIFQLIDYRLHSFIYSDVVFVQLPKFFHFIY